MENKDFAKGIIKGIYYLNITMPYDYFKIYINSISSKIDKELDDYEKKLEEKAKKHGVFSTLMQSVIHEVNKTTMPKYFNNAHFIFLYSKFEGDFKTICNVYQQQKKFKLSASDLGGQNYLSKSRHYLEKCFNLNMASLNTEWEIITKYQRVRNAIVHNNANIFNGNRVVSDQELYRLISLNNDLSVDDKTGDFFIKDKKYIIDFCELAKNYLTKTLDLMESAS